jgi:hypothetical protein
MTAAVRTLPIPLAVPRLAIVSSIVAHAVLALVVSRIDWPAASPREPVPVAGFIWMPPPPPSTPEPAAEVEPEPAAAAPPAAAIPQPAPVEEPPTVREEGMADPPPVPEAPGAAIEAPRAEMAPSRPVPSPQIDWERERQAAVTRALEQRDRYRRFGPDPLLELEDPDEAPRPSMFSEDTGTRSSRPSVLVPGQARTRVGRWLSNLCQLTGGISLFGVATACDTPEVDRGRYWYLRPTYLKRLPVCEDTRPGSPGSLAAPGTPESTIKCRLEAPIEP